VKLTKLGVRNFKKVESVELDLSNLNILVGGNGSGKSSIIQAIHLACCVMRQVDRVEPGRTSTVGIDALDYLPSNDYKRLGHNVDWGNNSGTPSSVVTLAFEQAGAELEAECELRSARNAGISITGEVPADLRPLLRERSKFFSAYIPGISGIPNKEEKRSRKVVLKACSYGDSNVILRNVLLLLKEIHESNIALIQQWIGEIAEPMTITVNYDDKNDLTISCDVQVGYQTRPIELIGTGYLQLIQMFAYILLFEPSILLIDEPDIHLNPTLQEKLVKVLARVAQERGLRVLLTTHSPFIVRGAPLDANVYWVKEGKVEATDRSAVELALGWGAFGKKIILVSEDSNTGLLKKLISQWPGLEKYVAYFPGTGYRSLTTPEQASEIAASLGGSFKIVVHRDRDSMTEAEMTILKKRYSDQGATLWCTEPSDIEGYFCQPEILVSLAGCSVPDAEAYIATASTKRQTDSEAKFAAHRKAHNDELYAAGGSPTNAAVLTELASRTLGVGQGKIVFRELSSAIPGNLFRADRLAALTLPSEIAPDLKTVLEQVLA
jgi:energy-coupling factor transporter ATP-binding protein EcfA2